MMLRDFSFEFMRVLNLSSELNKKRFRASKLWFKLEFGTIFLLVVNALEREPVCLFQYNIMLSEYQRTGESVKLKTICSSWLINSSSNRKKLDGI